jgi:anti-sigma factor RsiW
MRWDLLDRYLLGECSPAEREDVERWLAESPARKKLLEQLTTPDNLDSAVSRARIVAAWDRLRDELDPGRKLGGDD